MHIGELDQDQLYDCMAKEPRAEGVFYKAMTDLTRSMYKNEPELGVRAFDTLIAFVVDLAIEHEGNDWNAKICPVLTENADALENVKKMIGEVINPELTVKWNEDDQTMSFNGEDMTPEVMIMVEAF